ncbi:peptidylprolyl isomerase [Candidatus Woesearchaeota archaeon]|nr:peptidylprolyl isomerase [Candidatus Woesearchaeota archaeon]
MRKLFLGSLLVLILILSGCGDGEMTSRTKAIIETNIGNMEFELYNDLAPETAENFEKLAEDGFYDEARFHRVIKNFMIQGGDPLTKNTDLKQFWGTGGPGYAIKDEFVKNLRHDKKGILSMANSGPNTGGSQFFITLIPTPWLDDKHTIFGKLTAGEDILDKIGNVKTDENDRPVEDVIINKIEILK